MRTLAAIAVFFVAVGAPPLAQVGGRASDPRIRTELVAQPPKAGGPIVIDVYIQNLEQANIRKNQFSPISSSVGTPTFYRDPRNGGSHESCAGLIYRRSRSPMHRRTT